MQKLEYRSLERVLQISSQELANGPDNKFFKRRMSNNNRTKPMNIEISINKNDEGSSPSNTKRSFNFQKALLLQPHSTKASKFNSDSKNLPSIVKSALDSVNLKQQKKHFNFKQKQQQQTLLQRRGNSQKLAIINIQKSTNSQSESNSPLNVNTGPTHHIMQKSRFAQMKKKVVRSLEQVIIENVIQCSYLDEDECYDLRTDVDEHQQTQIYFQQKKNFLEGHNITEQNRMRMLDWMVQVFRVLKVSSPHTFFLSAAILDKYCAARQYYNESIDKEELYLIGLASVLMSSKYEDVQPIRMNQIVNDAGHGKFKSLQVVKQEREILKALEFKVHTLNIYEVSTILFKELKYEKKTFKLEYNERQFACHYLLFLCQLTVFSAHLTLQPQNTLSFAIAKLTFSFMIRKYRHLIKVTNDNLMKSYYEKYISYFKDLKLSLNQRNDPYPSFGQDVKRMKCQIHDFHRLTQTQSDKQNLEKNFPQFLGEEIVVYAFKNDQNESEINYSFEEDDDVDDDLQ